MAAKKPPIIPPAGVLEIVSEGIPLPGKGAGGQNVHIPDDKNRLIVTYMSAAGRPQDEIAGVLGMDQMTLRKYYRHELDHALGDMAKMVLGKLYKKIVVDEETAAILFFCKTRLGMKEMLNIDFPNGIPVAGDSAQVSDERTKQLIREVLNDL